MLCTQCKGIGPHLAAKRKSHGFSRVTAERYILELQWGISFIARVCSAMSGLLSSYEGYLRNLLEALKRNSDASQSEVGDQGSLFTCHSDIGIPINFQEESGIITF